MKRFWAIVVVLSFNILFVACSSSKTNPVDQNPVKAQPISPQAETQQPVPQEKRFMFALFESENVVKIYEPSKSITPQTITLNLPKGEVVKNGYNSLPVIEDNVFVVTNNPATKDLNFYLVGFEGQMKKVFSAKEDLAKLGISDYILSPDSSKIAYSEYKLLDPKSSKNELALSIIDLKNHNKTALFTRQYNDYADQQIFIDRWSNSNDKLFFGIRHTQLGGRFSTYRTYEQFYSINLRAEQLIDYASTITPKRANDPTRFPDSSDFISDLSADEKLLAYINKDNGQYKLYVKNLETDSVKSFEFPQTNLGTAGYARFNEEGNKICFEAHYYLDKEDATKDYTRLYIVDLVSNQISSYDLKDKPFVRFQKRWYAIDSPIAKELIKNKPDIMFRDLTNYH